MGNSTEEVSETLLIHIDAPSTSKCQTDLHGKEGYIKYRKSSCLFLSEDQLLC